MKQIKVTRNELFNRVWEEPLIHVAKRFKVPSSVVKKACDKNKIPLPPNGYWTKLKFGKSVPGKPKLSGGKKSTIIVFDPEKYAKKPAAEINKSRKKLGKPHPLVAQVRDYLKNEKPTSEYSIFPGILQSGRKMLNIDVTPKKLNRALVIMNEFIKQVNKRKHSVHVDYGTYVNVFDEKVHFRVREKMKQTDTKESNGWTTRKYSPSGNLVFVVDLGAYRHPEWLDKENRPLELKMPDVIDFMENHARKEIKYRIDSEIHRKIEEEKRKRLEELQRKKNNELTNFKKLLRHSMHWKQARVIREYINAVEQNSSLPEERKEWLSWAKQKIEWFAPFIQAPDVILDDSDREQLIKELNEVETKVKNNYFSYW